MRGQSGRKSRRSLEPAPAPQWHGAPISAEQARDALERAVEFKWDAYRAHQAVRIQAIAALTARGMTVREVADVLGISKSLVSKQLNAQYVVNPFSETGNEPDAGAPITTIVTPDPGRATRSRHLISEAWKGLWRAEDDPDFGTGSR